MQAIPAVYFPDGTAKPGPDGMATLDLVRWALASWDIHDVTVYGFASSEGSRNSRLALDRARFVADRLVADGVDAEASAAVPERKQRARELELGRREFRRVEVVPKLKRGAVD